MEPNRILWSQSSLLQWALSRPIVRISQIPIPNIPDFISTESKTASIKPEKPPASRDSVTTTLEPDPVTSESTPDDFIIGPDRVSTALATEPWTVPGLRNAGNTCFVNALLQAFASLPPFLNYLSQHNGDTVNDCSLSYLLSSFLHELRPIQPSLTPYMKLNPSSIEKFVNLHFQQYQQQDTLEVLHYLLEILDNQHVLNAAKVQGPFKGHVTNVLQCNTCFTFRPTCTTPFTALSLPLSDENSTLQHCILQYISPEIVHQVECNSCTNTILEEDLLGQMRILQLVINRLENGDEANVLQQDCKKLQEKRRAILEGNVKVEEEQAETEQAEEQMRRSFTKEFLISKVSDIICFHFHRKSFHNGKITKVRTNVSFPLELDMARVCSVNTRLEHSIAFGYCTLPEQKIDHNRSYLYALQAVIVHHGNATSGHYTAYRKVPNAWIHASDEDVTTVDVSQVLDSEAYILFYTRVTGTHN